ncbi:malectin domain-containing carbohydrate-binding protein [Pontibacter russatus]|uniref:malectin domain-containing carbohydrate-binding protein n=1 Tax=Pontibacter russatus TaxID=2694929 RepID=UPI00137B2A83|nr:malectin domain-containing carbohydrate-binding protein [Pontibacter russatus]
MKTFYTHFLLALVLLVWAAPAMSQSKTALGAAADVAGLFKAKSEIGKTKANNRLISHLVPGQDPLVLKIKKSKKEGAADVYIGGVEGRKHSTFFLKVDKGKLDGYVLLKEQKKAYKYASGDDGQAYLQEVDIDKVVCVEYQEAPAESASATGASDGTALVSTDLQSLPGASAVVLLDFNGQYVNGTYWNDGGEINAAPANLSEAEIIEAWKLISEDFRPFTINITTSESVYLSAPATSRMRVIFTPTDFFYPGAGGVAYTNSFTWGNETPCWVFNSSAKYAGEAGSHEIGHTLGLSHDGRTNPSEAYFYGQNSWAPIMGAGYYSEQVQWSKGEYAYASNLEDDLSIIAGQNGFGYKADDHANTHASATPLPADNTGSAPLKGIIGSRTDVDVFTFQTSGGNVEVRVDPFLTYANLDVLLTLKNSAGTAVAVSDPATAAAAITQSLPAGTYFVHIKGAKGALGANSDYNSMGEYTISAKYDVPVAAANASLLNAGGTALTDSQARKWGADAYFNGGTASSKSFDVQGTADDALYLAYRYAASGAPFSYRIPVSADGAYTVRLHFLEPYFGAPGGKTTGLTGARVFHVDMEGTRVLSNYDIYKQDGAGKAVVKTFENVSVSGGTLDLSFISVTNNAIISAIEIAPAASFTLTTSTSGSGTIARNPNQQSYASGKVVALTATPASGYQFSGWSGDATGTANPLSVTMNGNKAITANFVPVQQPASLVSNVSATSGRSYALAELVVGAKIYSDRTYQATTVPASLSKATLIRTANDDKRSTAATLLTFKLSQQATVYVAYDPRATALPAWLSGWQKVTDRVGVNDSKISYMNLYSKTFAAGTVSLGGNMVSPAAGAENNFFVLTQAQSSAALAVSQVQDAQSVAENRAAGLHLKVYPNPNTGDRVHINLENLGDGEAVTITVHDVLGRLVKTTAAVGNHAGSASFELPAQERLQRGLYIVSAKAGSRKLQAKLLVE